MANSLTYLLKILLLSAAISYSIKYLGPWLAIPATSLSVIIGITLPTIIMTILLGMRAKKSRLS